MLQAQLNKFYSHPVARVSFALVLTVLATLFFALVAIRPTLQTMAELIKQIEDRKQVDQKLSQKIATLSSAQAELAAKQADATALDKAVPSTPSFTLLLKEIEKLTSESNVVLVSLIVQSVPTERDPATVMTTEAESIPLILTFSGSYDNLLQMLHGLTSMQRVLVVDRLDVLPPTDKDTGTLNMSIALRAFAFGDSLTPKVVPQNRPKTGTTK